MDDKFQKLEPEPWLSVERKAVIYWGELVCMGYPAGYTKAERLLKADGYTYLIQHDAWISSSALEAYKATGKLPKDT